jgi:hypothetical protein
MSVTLPVIFITQSLVDETARLLATFAEGEDSEGVAYWFGIQAGEREIVTTLVVPDADTSRGHVHTSAAANAEAMSVMVDTPIVLLGQAHSHPSKRVDHSPVDDRDTFAQFPGALSVVVPFYGRRGIRLAECGVYRHIGDEYRRITTARVGEHVRIIPGFADFRRGTAH